MLGVYMLSASIIIAVLAPFLVLYDPLSYYADIEYLHDYYHLNSQDIVDYILSCE